MTSNFYECFRHEASDSKDRSTIALISTSVTVAFGEYLMSRPQFKLWYNWFKKSREDVNDEARPALPIMSTGDESCVYGYNIETKAKSPAFYNTNVLCVHFTVNAEGQIVEKLFHNNFIFSQSVCCLLSMTNILPFLRPLNIRPLHLFSLTYFVLAFIMTFAFELQKQFEILCFILIVNNLLKAVVCSRR